MQISVDSLLKEVYIDGVGYISYDDEENIELIEQLAQIYEITIDYDT